MKISANSLDDLVVSDFVRECTLGMKQYGVARSGNDMHYTQIKFKRAKEKQKNRKHKKKNAWEKHLEPLFCDGWIRSGERKKPKREEHHRPTAKKNTRNRKKIRMKNSGVFCFIYYLCDVPRRIMVLRRNRENLPLIHRHTRTTQ